MLIKRSLQKNYERNPFCGQNSIWGSYRDWLLKLESEIFHSKTDFRQFARTLRDFLHETCLIGVPSIDRRGAVARILNLYLGCTQSQLVSNEPITDINRSYLDLNKRQHNQHHQKQKLDKCLLIQTRLTMEKKIWEVVNIKEQLRAPDCSLRNAAG